MCKYLTVKILVALSMCLKLAGTGLNLAGSFTEKWRSNDNFTFGLLQVCTDGKCYDFSDLWNSKEKFHMNATWSISQILGLLGIVLSIISLALTVFQLFMDTVADICPKLRFLMPIVTLILAILSFLFIITCAGVMSITNVESSNELKIKDLQKLQNLKIGFSLVLSVVGGVLIALGGLLSAFVEQRKKKSKLDGRRDFDIADPRDDALENVGVKNIEPEKGDQRNKSNDDNNETNPDKPLDKKCEKIEESKPK